MLALCWLRLHILCRIKLQFNHFLLFADEFPEKGLWVDLPRFCLIKDITNFFHRELVRLPEYFFEVGIIKEGVTHCLNKVRAFRGRTIFVVDHKLLYVGAE